ncbi:MauE/DoxX family redox-associated membrane protein [Streptomyces sp. NBC_01198]|uniref:MauE/DoxX family redox-associated membrane protein n=1 Tax=Streptomyces sp. NBC_01198 TaxID=2903769 RepID=UPI002E16197D|nr:methylamine utilization protein MauE [Streptomyces sp. NBC_01198]
MEFVAMSCRILLLVVFTVAVVSKVRSAESFGGFVRSVRGFAALSPSQGRVVARAVIGAEAVVIVLLLLTGPRVTVGFALAGSVLAVFSLAIGASLRRGARVPCRCFGASTSSSGALGLVRNGFLIAVAVTGAVGTHHGLPPASGAVAAAGTGLVLGVVVTVLDDIAESLRDSFPVAVRKGQK